MSTRLPAPPTLPHRLRFGLAAALLALCGAGWAVEAAGADWNSLNGQQRSALAPLRGNWSSMDPTVQQKWLEIAAKYPKMSPEERQRMQERMSNWSSRSPQERSQARVNYQQSRQLSPEDRQARWEAYQALPEDQKRALADRAKPAPKPGPRARSDDDGAAKSNIVRAPGATGAPRPVAPTVVQAAPGATTTSMSRQAKPPAHQQTGLPKITATPNFVDSQTLLPKRGAQAAAVRSAAASAPARP